MSDQENMDTSGVSPEVWRQRGATVEAVQLSEGNVDAVIAWMAKHGCYASKLQQIRGTGHDGIGFGGTLGSFGALYGDWVIRRGQGFEIYLGAEFQREYERVPAILICIDEVGLMIRERSLLEAVKTIMLLGRSERITVLAPSLAGKQYRSWQELEDIARVQLWIGDVKGPDSPFRTPLDDV